MEVKQYSMSEKELKIIEAVKAENQYRSSAEALRHIVREYQQMKEGAGKEERRREGLERTILKSLEKDQKLLLDAINTMLIESRIELCRPVNFQESPVIASSRKYEKERLERFKQISDHRKNKGKL